MTAINDNHDSFSKTSVSSPIFTTPSTPNSDSSADTSAPNDTLLSPRQRLPYAVGFTTTATRHQPPEPFGLGYATEYPLSQRLENWETLSKPNYCISRQLVGGRAVEDDTKTLTITAVIRTGDNWGAQLVVMNNDIVAKIFDLLYYDEEDEYGLRKDVVFNAYSDYSCKAAAYNELRKSLAAQEVTPVFYGT